MKVVKSILLTILALGIAGLIMIVGGFMMLF